MHLIVSLQSRVDQTPCQSNLTADCSWLFTLRRNGSGCSATYFIPDGLQLEPAERRCRPEEDQNMWLYQKKQLIHKKRKQKPQYRKHRRVQVQRSGKTKLVDKTNKRQVSRGKQLQLITDKSFELWEEPQNICQWCQQQSREQQVLKYHKLYFAEDSNSRITEMMLQDAFIISCWDAKVGLKYSNKNTKDKSEGARRKCCESKMSL